MRESFKKAWNFRIWLSAALCLSLAAGAQAQNGRLELKNLDKLSNKASEVNDITLDGAMLSLAGSVVSSSGDPDAAEVKDALNGVKGIYIKNFEFDEPGQYSQEDVEGIRSQLTGPGWTRIVESRSKKSKETDEIYILKQADKVAGLVILVAEPTELTVVNLVGFIDVSKLGAIEGHFGVPGEESRHREKKEKPNHATPPPSKPSPDKKGDEDDADNQE